MRLPAAARHGGGLFLAELQEQAVPDFAALHQFRPGRYPHWLESAVSGTPHARYDILFALPGSTCCCCRATGRCSWTARRWTAAFWPILNGSGARSAAPWMRRHTPSRSAGDGSSTSATSCRARSSRHYHRPVAGHHSGNPRLCHRPGRAGCTPGHPRSPVFRYQHGRSGRAADDRLMPRRAGGTCGRPPFASGPSRRLG